MNHCEYCKVLATYQFKNGIYCCSSNVGKCPEIGQRRKQAYISKYGVENISQLNDIKVKKNNTFHKNYAEGSSDRNKLVDTKQNTWKKKDIESVNSKRQSTCVEKYGVDNPNKLESIRIKSKSTKKEKYGNENYTNRDKATETIREKYGVNYISQITEVHEKQQKYKWKDYTMPSGNTIRIQGYENKALDILLKEYNETDIVVDRKKLPEIWYNYNNKNRRYYADIFIPKDNLIIEVKSKWTFSVKKDQHLAKQQSCIGRNFNFEFWIFDEQNNFVRL